MERNFDWFFEFRFKYLGAGEGEEGGEKGAEMGNGEDGGFEEMVRAVEGLV